MTTISDAVQWSYSVGIWSDMTTISDAVQWSYSVMIWSWPMGMANGDGKKEVWPKTCFNKKDARRDFMKNAPGGASRSLTRSQFLQTHILNKLPCSIFHIPYSISYIPEFASGCKKMHQDAGICIRMWCRRPWVGPYLLRAGGQDDGSLNKLPQTSTLWPYKHPMTRQAPDY